MTTRGHDADRNARPPYPMGPTMNPADAVDMLTNLPGLLGYHPRECLVLVFGDRFLCEPGPVLVRGIDGTDVDAVRLAAGDMAAEGHERADVYVISEAWPGGGGDGDGGNDLGGTGDGHDLRRRCDGIVAALEDFDIDVVQFAGVDAVYAGASVTDADGHVLGVLGDPAVSWASDRLHSSGEAIAANVESLRERFHPEPAGLRIAAGEALRRADDDVRGLRRAGGGSGPEAMDLVREHHLEWLSLVGAVDRGDISVDDALTEPMHLRILARPLVSLLLRDLTMCEILGDVEDTVRALWLGCARIFRGTARANALACYAIDRHVHGNATIAKAALDAALVTDPGHSLSQLLLVAMTSGRGEEALRSMLEVTTAILGEVHPEDGEYWSDEKLSISGGRNVRGRRGTR